MNELRALFKKKKKKKKTTGGWSNIKLSFTLVNNAEGGLSNWPGWRQRRLQGSGVGGTFR